MTDHNWAQERIATAAVGGLPADEAARLDAHAAACPDCAAALADARALDRGLDALFAPVRPGPAVDVRVVRKLRQEWTRRTVLAGWHKKLAAGVAASVGLGLTGAGASLLAGGDGLPMPGGGRMWSPARDDRTSASAVGDFNRALSSIIYGVPEADDGQRSHGPASQSYAADSVRAPMRTLDPDIPAIQDKLKKEFALGDPLAALSVNETKARVEAGEQSGVLWGAQVPPHYARIEAGTPPSVALYMAPPGVEPSTGAAVAYSPNAAFKLRKPEAANGAGYFQPHNYYLETGKDGKSLGDVTAGFGGQRATTPDGESLKATDHALGMAAKPTAGAGAIPVPTPAPVVGQPPKPADPAPPAIARKVIRSGEIEFEVDSFDSAVAAVTKLVAAINGGFVATVNSEKLPNGKVKGSVVVRVPPEALDGLVLDLRRDLGKAGELKGQKIGSQDITKQYFDLESRLKAARAMEGRLLEMIKTGKGEIKQLLDAEKELGVWRTRIEEYEGELRYYANQVSLSTLTITLAEKEIRAAAGLTESERVQAGVEVEEVEQAFRQIQSAVAEAKGRVTKSELKQLAAGQFNATLHFEVTPDAAGPVRDRLRQLGRVARLEIDRVQTADGTVSKDAKVKKGDTRFEVQLYNLANIQPRETAVLTVAVPDVPAGYQALRDAVAKANGRVLVAQLNEQDRQNVTGQLDFEVKRTEEAAVRAALDAAGDVVARQVTRAPEGDAVTDTKVRFQAVLVSATRLKPRETSVLTVEVADVDERAATIGAQVAEAKGRQVDVRTDRERNGKVTAKLVYDVPLTAAAGLVEQVKRAGKVRVTQSSRDLQAPEGKYAVARLEVTLTNAEQIVPPDDGVWPQVRKGLSFSASVLLTSLMWIVVGLCVVVPWAVVGYGGYRLVRRLFRTRPEAPAA